MLGCYVLQFIIYVCHHFCTIFLNWKLSKFLLLGQGEQERKENVVCCSHNYTDRVHCPVIQKEDRGADFSY